MILSEVLLELLFYAVEYDDREGEFNDIDGYCMTHDTYLEKY